MNTRSHFLLLALAMACRSSMAISPDSLIAQAEAAYAASDHAAALALYDSVAHTHTSASLEYNIGHCHYRLGHVGPAILHYERALLLAPGDEAVRADLELARQRVLDRMPQMPGTPLMSLWARLRGGQDPDQWARRSLLLVVIFFTALAAAVQLRARGPRIAAFVVSGTVLPLAVAAIVLAALRHGEITGSGAAIIMAPRVDVLSEPRAAATKLYLLHEGTRVELRGAVPEWKEVRLENGGVGWVRTTQLERI